MWFIVERNAGSKSVEIGGELFTEYVHGDGASRPYCYPITAADGTRLTRDFPMQDTPGEDRDHPWHRSLMFAHSMVGGVEVLARSMDLAHLTATRC